MRSSPEEKKKDQGREDAFLAAKSASLEKPNSHSDVIEEIAQHGYIPLFLSDNLEQFKDTQYRSIIFANPHTKKILFSNTGVSISKGIKGITSSLVDELRLRSGYLPKKSNHAQETNELVLKLLEEGKYDLSEWKFEYTGYSLGAVISKMQSLDMFMRLKDRGITPAGKMEVQVESKLFDSPSYFSAAKSAVDQYNKQHETEHKLNDILSSQKSEIFQARPNLINVFSEDKMLGMKNDTIYETFNLSPKQTLYDKFLSSKIGKKLWKIVKSATTKLIKRHGGKLTAAAIGGAIGTLIFPGVGSAAGVGVGLVVSTILQEVIIKEIKKILKSERVQTAMYTLLDMPEAINVTIKSHRLENFNGIGKDPNIILLKLKNPRDNKTIEKLGITGARLLDYDKTLFDKIKEHKDSKTISEGDDIKGFKNYILTKKKYFIEGPNNELLRCSRKTLLEVVRGIAAEIEVLSSSQSIDAIEKEIRPSVRQKVTKRDQNQFKESKKEQTKKRQKASRTQTFQENRTGTRDGIVHMEVDYEGMQTTTKQVEKINARKLITSRDPEILGKIRRENNLARKNTDRKRLQQKTRASWSEKEQERSSGITNDVAYRGK